MHAMFELCVLADSQPLGVERRSLPADPGLT